MIVYLGIAALITAIGYQLFRLYEQKHEFTARLETVEAHVSSLISENEALAADATYYEHPKSLLKTFRKLFNYRLPGEEFYIIVPEGND